MRVLIVGSMNVVFVHSYALKLIDAGHEVDIVDVGQYCEVESLELASRGVRVSRWSRWFKAAKPGGMKSRVRTFAKKTLKLLRLDRSKLFLVALSKVESGVKIEPSREFVGYLKKVNPDRILYLWSTTVKSQKRVLDLCFVENKRPNSYLIVNTYPVRSNASFDEVFLDMDEDRGYFSSFERVVLTSKKMESYFLKHHLISAERICIFDDRLSHHYYARKPHLARSNGKRLVFLGNVKYSERTIDDVRSQLLQLMDYGFDVWVQEGGDRFDSRLNEFKPFSYDKMIRGELGQFISGFDAVFMGYNSLDNARSNISFPTRFALGLLGRVPILIEKGVFLAIEELFCSGREIILYERLDEIPGLLTNYEPINSSDSSHSLLGAFEEMISGEM